MLTATAAGPTHLPADLGVMWAGVTMARRASDPPLPCASRPGQQPGSARWRRGADDPSHLHHR